eukprot:1157570-Pelagomonas_calceolata.AAC.17
MAVLSANTCGQTQAQIQTHAVTCNLTSYRPLHQHAPQTQFSRHTSPQSIVDPTASFNEQQEKPLACEQLQQCAAQKAHSSPEKYRQAHLGARPLLCLQGLFPAVWLQSAGRHPQNSNPEAITRIRSQCYHKALEDAGNLQAPVLTQAG